MKINLKKLAEVEASYNNNKITLNAIQHMIDIVMAPTDPLGLTNESGVILASQTLKDLGIIEVKDANDKEVKQLNS